jgi:hypothetical protein
MKAPCKIWRTSETRAIDAALDAGIHPEQIGRDLAARLGRTVESVATVARVRRRARLPPGAKMGRRWTRSELRRLDAALATETGTTRQIAARIAPRMDRTVCAVRQRLDERRARFRPRPRRQHWTEAEVEEVLRLRREGATWQQIADRMGRPVDSVRRAKDAKRRT